MKSAILKIISIILLAYFILSVCSCSEQKKVEKENSMIDLLFQKDSTLLDNSYISSLPKEVIQDVRISDADMNSIKYVIFSASYFGISEVTNTNAAILITDNDSIQLLKDLFLNNDLRSFSPGGYNYRIQFFDSIGNSVCNEMYLSNNVYSRNDDEIKKIVHDLSIRMDKYPTHYIYNIEVAQDMYSAMEGLRDNGFKPFVLEGRIYKEGNRSSFQILDGKNFRGLKKNLRRYPFVRRFKKALNSLEIDEYANSYSAVISTNKIENIGPFVTAEQMPQFPGGETEMYSYISKNLKYPDEAIESGVAGHRMIIRFVIHSSGKVLDAKIIRGIHPQCDSIALDMIGNMPDWIPGKQNGQAVSVYYTLPISFHFQ